MRVDRRRLTDVGVAAIHGALSTLSDDETRELFQLEEYRARLAQRAGTLALVQRRLIDSKQLLESRLVRRRVFALRSPLTRSQVVAADPSIRKSFIAPRTASGKVAPGAVGSGRSASQPPPKPTSSAPVAPKVAPPAPLAIADELSDDDE